MEHTGAEAFNLGTGHAVSVLELVNTFMEATGVNVPYVIGPRREGDLPQMWADTHKAETILGWKPRRPCRYVPRQLELRLQREEAVMSGQESE